MYMCVVLSIFLPFVLFQFHWAWIGGGLLASQIQFLTSNSANNTHQSHAVTTSGQFVYLLSWLLLYLKDFHYVVLLQVAHGARVRISYALAQWLLAVLNVQRKNHGLLDVLLRRDIERGHWENLHAFVVLSCHCLFASKAIIICSGHAHRKWGRLADIKALLSNLWLQTAKWSSFSIEPLIERATPHWPRKWRQMSTMAACKYPTEPRSPRRNPGFSYLNVPCSPSHSVHSQTTVPRHLTYDGKS